MNRNSCLCVLALATMVLSANGAEPKEVLSPEDLNQMTVESARATLHTLHTGGITILQGGAEVLRSCRDLESVDVSTLDPVLKEALLKKVSSHQRQVFSVLNTTLTDDFLKVLKASGGYEQAAKILEEKAATAEFLFERAKLISENSDSTSEQRNKAWRVAYNALEPFLRSIKPLSSE